MTNNSHLELHERCHDVMPCAEVVDRLTAADRSEREGFLDAARRLRETALRWFEIHHDETEGAR